MHKKTMNQIKIKIQKIVIQKQTKKMKLEQHLVMDLQMDLTKKLETDQIQVMEQDQEVIRKVMATNLMELQMIRIQMEIRVKKMLIKQMKLLRN